MASRSTEEQEFLQRLRRSPFDPIDQIVYADWLEERSDPRAKVLRLNLVMRYTSPDNADRSLREQAYSQARAEVSDRDWLDKVDRKRRGRRQYACRCMGDRRTGGSPILKPQLHTDWQDTLSPGWLKLNDRINLAIADEVEDFSPLNHMTEEEISDVVTLPPTIAQLKGLQSLRLYASNLVRIPPEIGSLLKLETFTPYTSYRLHWFPYEIANCPALTDSTISTRALYGNYKFRSPFPKLEPILTGVHPDVLDALQTVSIWDASPTRPCSVCRKEFADEQKYRYWISLRVATDVVPLLVNACSEDCVQNLPQPGSGYIPGPHLGGDIEQPTIM